MGEDAPTGLRKWLCYQDGGLRQSNILGVSMGPNGSYIAWTSHSHTMKHVNPDLVSFWESCARAGDGDIRLAALGHDGGFLMVTRQGSMRVIADEMIEEKVRSLAKHGRLEDLQVSRSLATAKSPFNFRQNTANVDSRCLQCTRRGLNSASSLPLTIVE